MTLERSSREEEEATQERSKDMPRTEVDREPKRLDRGLLIGAAAAALLLVGACQSSEEAPVTEAPGANEAQESSVDAKALEVATGFVEAYGAFDADRAITHLADDAVLSDLGLEGPREFRLLLSLFEAQGNKQILDTCEALVEQAAGTYVRCTYDFHAIRSDEIGLGPYSGSYWNLTVRDGEIVRATDHFETGEFSPEMWEPFAAWVSTNYPEDVAVMYTDAAFGDYRLSRESIRLWELHSREYVEEVERA